MDETMEHANEAHALKVPNKINRKFKSYRGPWYPAFFCQKLNIYI